MPFFHRYKPGVEEACQSGQHIRWRGGRQGCWWSLWYKVVHGL